MAKGVFRVKTVDLLPVFWSKLIPLYQKEIPKVEALYRTALRHLAKLRPQCLVVDEDATEAQRALVRAANVLGIHTLVILHGLPASRFGFLPLEADRMAVWGPYCSSILQQWGLSESRISVTGCPKYDPLSPVSEQEAHEAKREVCRKFHLEAGRPLILIVLGGMRANALEAVEGEAHTSPGEILKTVRYFTEIASRTPQANFICKFRLVSPRDLQMFHSAKALPDNMRFSSEGLALPYIKGADLVFCHFSSAVLEAVMLKKPVVQMNFSNYEDGFPFSDSGLGAAVSTCEEALQLCARWAAGEVPRQEWIDSQERLIELFLYARDGRASQRIAETIQKTIKHHKNGGMGHESLSENVRKNYRGMRACCE